jgi:hypothetical protein
VILVCCDTTYAGDVFSTIKFLRLRHWHKVPRSPLKARIKISTGKQPVPFDGGSSGQKEIVCATKICVEVGAESKAKLSECTS